ncbi:DUF202 domain-containing protein [Enemella sp. A6]|uniref:DUF202 domain-containing protein n=1 Tax=Enemella sp. A6 TaxID=3440152 RepID=UPI003EBBD945
MNTPFDPGLQPERTMLAWSRTVLALAVGSLVYARIAVVTIGLWAWALAGAGLAVAVVVAVESRKRYGYTHRSLSMGRVKLADGLLPAFLAAAVFLAGVVILVLTLVGPNATFDQLR